MNGSNQQVASARPLLDVVVPCYNEHEVLGQFWDALKPELDRLDDSDWRVHFVDDGSDDGTLALLNGLAAGETRIRVWSLSRNFGHQLALTAGIDVADGDAVVMLDCDLQHPPELIGRMVELWRAGHEVVSAVREATADAGWLKRLGSAGFYRLINSLSDTPIVPGAADFCLLDRRAADALRRMPERHRFLRGMISWIGFRRALVGFRAPARAAGRPKYDTLKSIRFALTAVFSFSAVPVRLVGRAGIVIALLGAAYLVYAIAVFAIGARTVAGWTSTIAVLCILGGLQLVAIAISGEYVARVFEQTKGRPLYLFKQTPEDRPGAVEAGGAAEPAPPEPH
jgi:dolichol-phosphate mannosyltransferase